MRYSLLAFFALLLSCGGDDGGVTAPSTGSLEIRASTSGEAGADYMIAVDGEPGRALQPNGALTISDLESGAHVVELLAPPPGCTVAGDNPRVVTVSAGSTNVVTFVVSCVPLLGSIQVSTVTSGAGPATYELLMDGTSIGMIGASAARIIEKVPPGPHSIDLRGVPATCQVQGAVPQTVTVEASASAAVSFAITCSPAETGTLTIVTNTTGTDPNGYQVSVDGGPARAIGLNATLALLNTPAGAHTVLLSDLAPNCSVAGSNPQTATVPASGAVTVTFAVTCTAPEPTTGTLRIVTVTTGGEGDEDGYRVAVNDGDPEAIGDNAELSLTLAPGTYTVTLSGVAENCSLPEPEQSAEVSAGETAEVEFTITCVSPTGSLRVTTTTAGSDPDEDGYLLLLDDEEQGPIDSEGEETIGDLTEGEHTVELTGVADNCEVEGENPRTVSVTAGETVDTEFAVTCTAAEEPTGSIRVQVATTGATPDEDGYELTLDGADPEPVEADGEITFEGITTGSHELELSGAAPNCTVADGTTRTVEVTAGDIEEVLFNVECP